MRKITVKFTAFSPCSEGTWIDSEPADECVKEFMKSFFQDGEPDFIDMPTPEALKTFVQGQINAGEAGEIVVRVKNIREWPPGELVVDGKKVDVLSWPRYETLEERKTREKEQAESDLGF